GFRSTENLSGGLDVGGKISIGRRCILDRPKNFDRPKQWFASIENSQIAIFALIGPSRPISTIPKVSKGP
ncbi:hypothetical protein DVA76_18595, partial [Acinetobacter baumannii]